MSSKWSNKRVFGVLGVSLIIIFAGSLAGLYIYNQYLQNIVNPPTPPPPGGQYKTITYHFSVLSDNGAIPGVDVTGTVYTMDQTPLTSATCNAAGGIDFVLPSGEQYYIFLNRASSASWDTTYLVTLPAVEADSGETEYTFPTALILHLVSATYTQAIVEGGTSVSRTQAAGAMTGATSFPVTAGTNVDFQFQTTNGDDYSQRGYAWYIPKYQPGVYSVWVIVSNMSMNVVSAPSAYETWQGAGVANYTVAFQADPVLALASAVTLSQTLTLSWATAVGSPSFEVYFLWNTTLGTLKNALFGISASGTHATTTPAPLGYTIGGLFQVTDGTYCRVNTT